MRKTLIILGMVVALVILPLFISHGGEYGGSDGEVKSQTQATVPYYEPRLQSLCESTGGGIESLSFTLRGSLGAAVIFYTPGYTKGR